MPRPPTVVLFDVDGTLVSTGGAGSQALRAALEDVCGITGALGFYLGGMTDRMIVRRALTEAEHPPAEDAIDAVIARYLERLPAAVDASRDYKVYPGVGPLLDELAPLPDVATGLGTGNVRRGAEIKLARGGLHRRFRFGGFGCDHEDRARLLLAGAARGAGRLGQPLDRCRLVVVGDTPRDVTAALAIGARPIAVATARHDIETLRLAGAARALPDLTHAGALAAILG